MRRETTTSSAASIAVTAALVAVGCALGAEAGLLARFPGLGAAILFLPYAIVTAALLRSAPRHWWIILLAAAAGNFLPHWRSGESVAFVLLAEVVNDARAIIAALGIRRYATRSGRFESLRQMVAYLVVAVLVAPALAALGGAGLVSWLRTSPGFWLVWQQWWLSNAITGLIVLPLLTVDVRALLSAWRPPPRPPRGGGGTARRVPAGRRRGRVRAFVRSLPDAPGAPLLGAAVLALGGRSLRPARHVRRPDGRHLAVRMGRDRGARPVRARCVDGKLARAAGLPAGGLDPGAAAGVPDRATTPDGVGAHGHREAQVGRDRAAREQPAQGRIPGDARTRAAQPAGADQHRPADSARGAAGQPRRRVGARVDRPPVEPHDAAARRPAGHLARHAGQDRAAARAGQRRSGDRERGGGDAPAHRLGRPPADGQAARGRAA